MAELLFLKLGGSLLTDKTGVEAARQDVIERLAREIQLARLERPGVSLLIGHGSGSFGHVAAAKHGTRNGVRSADAWHGFCEVSNSAARLNALVRKALLETGIPAVTLQPSASSICQDGQIATMAVEPVRVALAAGIVPVVYGDVAFDHVRGGTIISTEEIFSFLANHLRPNWLLLAGETEGVLDEHGRVIPLITQQELIRYQDALGGSRGTDVTGGMIGKVEAMLALCKRMPDLSVRIFSGLDKHGLHRVLVNPGLEIGTRLKYE